VTISQSAFHFKLDSLYSIVSTRIVSNTWAVRVCRNRKKSTAVFATQNNKEALTYQEFISK